jgi:hypothetical protein
MEQEVSILPEQQSYPGFQKVPFCSFTRPGLELTIYRTRGEHANHYVTYAFDHAMRESQQTTYRDKKGS